MDIGEEEMLSQAANTRLTQAYKTHFDLWLIPVEYLLF